MAARFEGAGRILVRCDSIWEPVPPQTVDLSPAPGRAFLAPVASAAQTCGMVSAAMGGLTPCRAAAPPPLIPGRGRFRAGPDFLAILLDLWHQGSSPARVHAIQRAAGLLPPALQPRVEPSFRQRLNTLRAEPGGVPRWMDGTATLGLMGTLPAFPLPCWRGVSAARSVACSSGAASRL